MKIGQKTKQVPTKPANLTQKSAAKDISTPAAADAKSPVVGEAPVGRPVSLVSSALQTDRSRQQAATESLLGRDASFQQVPQKSEQVSVDAGLAADLKRGMLSTHQPLAPGRLEGGKGISTDTPESAETRVREQSQRDMPYSLDELKQHKLGFLSSLSQVDGDKGTTLDQKMCAVSSVFGGMILSDPSSVPDMAEKLLTKEAGEEFPRLKDPKVQEALKRIAGADDSFNATRFSPADLNTVALAMLDSKESLKQGGVDYSEAMALVGRLNKLGVEFPDMELHMFASQTDRSAGAHWQSYANGWEFDPWPGEDGRAVLKQGAEGLSHGGTHHPNGGLHTKVFIRDGGEQIQVDQHIRGTGQGRTSDQSRPLVSSKYKLKSNGIYKRESFNQSDVARQNNFVMDQFVKASLL